MAETGYVIQKVLSKKQMANRMGICSRTLANWLNKKYYNELLKLGYEKTDKYLTPRIQGYLLAKLE